MQIRSGLKTIRRRGCGAVLCLPRRPRDGLCQSVGRCAVGGRSQRWREYRLRPRCRRRDCRGMGRFIGAEIDIRLQPEFLARERLRTQHRIDLMGNIIVGVPIGGHARARSAPIRHRWRGTPSKPNRWGRNLFRCRPRRISSAGYRRRGGWGYFHRSRWAARRNQIPRVFKRRRSQRSGFSAR